MTSMYLDQLSPRMREFREWCVTSLSPTPTLNLMACGFNDALGWVLHHINNIADLRLPEDRQAPILLETWDAHGHAMRLDEGIRGKAHREMNIRIYQEIRALLEPRPVIADNIEHYASVAYGMKWDRQVIHTNPVCNRAPCNNESNEYKGTPHTRVVIPQAVLDVVMWAPCMECLKNPKTYEATIQLTYDEARTMRDFPGTHPILRRIKDALVESER